VPGSIAAAVPGGQVQNILRQSKAVALGLVSVFFIVPYQKYIKNALWV